MKEELETKYVPPYFYEFIPPPFVQLVGLIHFHPNRPNSPPLNQIMECQPTLDIMAKIDNLLWIMNSFNQNSKSSVPCVIPTASEVDKKSDNSKSKNTEKDFSKISLTTKCDKCQGYGHIAANYPSPFKIAINDEVPI